MFKLFKNIYTLRQKKTQLHSRFTLNITNYESNAFNNFKWNFTFRFASFFILNNPTQGKEINKKKKLNFNKKHQEGSGTSWLPLGTYSIIGNYLECD
jgi:hypothetical protein